MNTTIFNGPKFKSWRIVGLASVAFVLASCDKQVTTNTEIRIGVVASLEGPFKGIGTDGMRGFELALREHPSSIEGRPIKVFRASSNGRPESATAAVQKLIDQEKVDIVIGPVTGGEGMAVKELAAKYPQVTFMNGSAASQEATLVNPLPNYFRYSTDGAQWMAGVGREASARGYKRVITIGEDYNFPFAQVRGFMLEFCSVGGKVEAKHWVPIGTKDFSNILKDIPAGTDAIFVALAGSQAIEFFRQYSQMERRLPLIAGTSTLDNAILNEPGVRADLLLGTITGGPVASSSFSPNWMKFSDAYKKQFPDGLSVPGLGAYSYYVNTKGALLGLEKVRGSLDGDQKTFRAALSSLTIDSPTGPLHLDGNRNGVATIFVSELARNDQGMLFRKIVRLQPSVDQDLKFSRGIFTRIGWARPDSFPCNAEALSAK